MKKQNQLLLAALSASLIFSACNKMQESSNLHLTTKDSTGPNELVPTPGGMIPRSNLHLIENGYKLGRQGSHIVKLDAKTGSVVADFGEIDSKRVSVRPGSHSSAKLAGQEATSWVTWAQWGNTSTSPINSFTTTWTVPNNPGSSDGQLLYIFNGLENAAESDIMQPVMQWGSGPAGGGNYWSIANWYVEGSIGFFSTLIEVNPGTNLTGVIQLNGQNPDGSYSYTSSFANYSNPLTISEGDVSNGNTIPAVPQQTLAFETLEAYGPGGYGVTQASDYPAGQNYINMGNILISGGSSSSGWTAETGNTNFGESTNATPKASSAIFIYWHAIPTINNSTAFVPLTTTSTSYTINAYPGTLVNVELTADPPFRGPGTTTSTLTITTPGVTFTGGSTSVSATNRTYFYSVTMPTSGSLTVNGSYTSTIPPGITKPANVYVF